MKVTEIVLELLPPLPLSLLSPDPLPQPLTASASERATAATPVILFVLLNMCVTSSGFQRLLA